MKTKRQTKKRSARRTARGGVRVVARADLPTRFGHFSVLGVEGATPEESAVVLVHGKPNGRTAPLVRIHSQCLTGDVLGSERCDCRAQLELSLEKNRRGPGGSAAVFAARGARHRPHE